MENELEKGNGGKKRTDVSCYPISPTESVAASVRRDIFRVLVPEKYRGNVRRFLVDKLGERGLRFLGYESNE